MRDLKQGDLLRLKGTGPARVVWCDSHSGAPMDSAFFPAGTAALFVDFSLWSVAGRGELLVVIGGRRGLVWSEEVEPL